MEELVNFILNGNYELNAEVIIRLVVVMMGLELFTAVCGLIGGMKGGR